MGTRADFYVGRGQDAVWIGSIAYDGHPTALPPEVRQADGEAAWRAHISDMLLIREDGIPPQDGWPWPWEDSCLTDFSYAWDEGKVWGCNYGGPWFTPCDVPPEDAVFERRPKSEFPDMSKGKQHADMLRVSGLTIFRT